MSQTITHLRYLRGGDRILSLGSIKYRRPLTVQAPLGPLPHSGAPHGQSVEGVYIGTLAGGVEFYLYPSQCAGQAIVIERD